MYHVEPAVTSNGANPSTTKPEGPIALEEFATRYLEELNASMVMVALPSTAKTRTPRRQPFTLEVQRSPNRGGGEVSVLRLPAVVLLRLKNAHIVAFVWFDAARVPTLRPACCGEKTRAARE
jgi:hypothetical protein